MAAEWPLEERALSGVTIMGQVSVEGHRNQGPCLALAIAATICCNLTRGSAGPIWPGVKRTQPSLSSSCGERLIFVTSIETVE